MAQPRFFKANLSRLARGGALDAPESDGQSADTSTTRTGRETRHSWQADRLVTPPPCPDGWEIGPPSYVGVGVQKAGTTWWHRQITSHPEVLAPVRKELHFFQHQSFEEFLDHHIEEYHRYFPRTEALVTGEWTPRYMLDPVVPSRVRRAAPHARILVLLRDPMKRLESNLRQYLGKAESIHPRVILEAIQRGRYPEQLESLSRAYPRDQILVLQFEKCVRSPESELVRTYEFIGIEPTFVPSDLREPLKQGRGEVPHLPSDLEGVAKTLYESDLPKLASDWPEIDLDLWTSLK